MTIFTAHPIVSTERMTWCPGKRLFAVEASEIGPMTRVYDDACDVGLTVVSRYPGRKPITFVVEHEERDVEGDVLWWDLKPADLSLRRRTPAGSSFGVRVLND